MYKPKARYGLKTVLISTFSQKITIFIHGRKAIVLIEMFDDDYLTWFSFTSLDVYEK